MIQQLPQEQIQRVFGQSEAPRLKLGFFGVYERLADIIPLHWTVLDLGCAYAPQAWLFKDHAAYVGVDWEQRERFAAPNTTHHLMSVDDYLRDHIRELPHKTFVVCCNVPPFQSDAMAVARKTFQNVFTYFPGNHDYRRENLAPLKAVGTALTA